MTYESFQQGPAVFIPEILISLVITLAAYCAFPLVFARTRKKSITKRKYNILCYCVNFLVNVLFIAVNGEASSAGPYILWTWVFSASGIKTLQSRGVLDGFQPVDYTNTATYSARTVIDTEATDATNTEAKPPLMPKEKPRIRFCRNCGAELIVGSNFCIKCGTAVVKE